MFRTIRLTVATLCFGLLSLSSGAADDSAAKAIQERLSALEKAWERGDAAYAASQVFGRDVVIQGEGQKETIQSPAAVLDTMKHLMEGSKQVRLSVHSVRNLAPGVAHSWVTWQVTPKDVAEKPFEVRSLFVWSKGKDGWRIRADSYSLGAM